jgi:hypothetical protein
MELKKEVEDSVSSFNEEDFDLGIDDLCEGLDALND